MKIQKLSLKNFRSHQETVLKLDRFNFIRGPNGCGKSSIQMALEYLFTGRCELTDGAGRGAEGLIRVGEKELEVSATLENGDTVCRRRAPRSQIVEINNTRVPVDVAESFLTRCLGPVEVVSAVLNADRFVEMCEERQKRLLGQLIEVGKIEFPNEIRNTLGDVGEDELKLTSIRDIETAYEHFLDIRRETGHALDALCQPGELGAGSRLSAAGRSREQVDHSWRQLGWVANQTSEADICCRNARPSDLAEHGTAESLFEIRGLCEEGELLEIESSARHAEELRRELADLSAEHASVAASLSMMQGLKGKCPTCGQSISEDAKAKEIDAFGERLADLRNLIQRTLEELNCYGDPQAAFDSGRNPHALTQPAHLSGGPSSARGPEKSDTVDAKRQITIGSEGIRRKERALTKVQQPRTEEAHPKGYASNKTALETKLHASERLTEFFGPNGPVMRETSRRMEQFREDINRRLVSFGYSCNLTLEPFEIRVSSPGGSHGLLLRQLSESERFRFAIAFQLALATVTGIRFVVIDRADILDRARRKVLTGLLLGSGIEQAIVLATSEEPAPVSIPAGVRFFDLAQPTKSREADRSPGSGSH